MIAISEVENGSPAAGRHRVRGDVKPILVTFGSHYLIYELLEVLVYCLSWLFEKLKLFLMVRMSC
jgi:hypothetical protein